MPKKNPPKIPHIEASKEFVRMLIIAVVPVMIASLEQGWDWKPTGVALGIAVLRTVEKYAHEKKKIQQSVIPTIPF